MAVCRDPRDAAPRSPAGGGERSPRVAIRARPSRRGGGRGVDSDRRGGRLRGCLLYPRDARGDSRVRALRVPRNCAAGRAGGRLAPRVRAPRCAAWGNRAVGRDDRPELGLATADTVRVLWVTVLLTALCATVRGSEHV